MRTRIVVPAVLLSIATVVGALAPAGAVPAFDTPRHPAELDLPPIDYEALEPVREMLPCGIPLLAFENHDLPLVYVSIWFPMGRRYLPNDRFAACAVFDELWRSGGTKTLDPDSLDRVLADLDASIYSWTTDLSGGVGVYLVKEDMEEALPLWREVALRPRFDGARLERAKGRHLKDIQAIRNRPSRIAEKRLDWLLLGRDNPEAHVETRAEIEAVTREDVLELHRLFVHPSRAIIGASGDFDRGELAALLEDLLREWAAGAEAPIPLVKADWKPAPSPGVYLLPGDYAQSQICVGRIDSRLALGSADYPVSKVTDFAFGWGRIYYRSREKGLSYGTAVFIRTDDEKSSVLGFGSGRAEVTGELVRVILDGMRNLSEEPFTADEVEAARTYRIGAEVSEDERPRDVVRGQVRDVVEGRPFDFREKYIAGLKRATAEDVNAAARKYLAPIDSLVVLVVGDPNRFAEPLEALGLGEAKILEPYTFGE
jgi:zinc protease